MAYKIRYLRRAREEADQWRTTYGQHFAATFDRWLVFLANAAEKGNETAASIDALEIFEQAMDHAEEPVPSQWRYSWEKFKALMGSICFVPFWLC